MIQLILSNNDYQYDIHSLVKAFYPNEEIKFGAMEDLDKDAELQIFIQFDTDKIQIKALKDAIELHNSEEPGNVKEKSIYKNIYKRMIYHCLNHITGKELPWGTLTGVRPTKIALERLEQNVSKKQIEDFMSKEYLCSKEKIDISLQVAERELILLKEMDYKNGYSVYVGIPFCPSTCLYCSFTSYSSEKFGDFIEKYLKALYKEISFAATCLQNKKLTTVYLGGGTPTTLTAEQLDGLLSHIENSFDFTYVMEYTVEAGRPDSITYEKLQVLKDHQVNRISINPQTMRQKTLDLIGRKHSVDQVVQAFHMAREIGHHNINMDLIIGLPGEDKEDVAYTLNEIDKLQPDSLTVHTLALKRAARLNVEKSNYEDLKATDTVEMQHLTKEYTSKAGFLPYYLYRQKNMAENLENVGYSKFGKEGLYNILIMEEKQTILALGAGASSKFVFHRENRLERVENVKSLKDYIERIDEMIERKRSFIENAGAFL